MYNELYGIKYIYDEELLPAIETATQNEFKKAHDTYQKKAHMHLCCTTITCIIGVVTMGICGYGMWSDFAGYVWFQAMCAILAMFTLTGLLCSILIKKPHSEPEITDYIHPAIKYRDALKEPGLTDAKIRLTDDGTAVLQLFFDTFYTTSESHMLRCIGIKPFKVQSSDSHEAILDITAGILYTPKQEIIELQNQCKQTFEDICNKYQLPLKSIDGAYLPEFITYCHNHDIIEGRDVYLTSVNAKNVLSTLTHQKQRRELLNLITDVQEESLVLKSQGLNNDEIDTQMSQKYRGDLIGAYKNVLKSERDFGIIRIPCTITPCDKDATVRSQWGTYTINYAPNIIWHLDCHDAQDTAAAFTDAVLFAAPCSLITVRLNQGFTKESVRQIRPALIDIINCFNDYYRAEYELFKNNKNYQHRNDVDPALVRRKSQL